MGSRRQRTDVKWIRLQEICLALVDNKLTLHVHGSTDLPIDLRAAVSQEGQRVDIVMNLLYNKNLEDVIDSLAHEMTHIVRGVGDEGHGPKFNRKWKELRKSMTHEYQDLELLAKARSLAKAHLAGCVDKAGKPKFGHAERVADKLTPTIDKTVAFLHDLLEDTKYGADQLKQDFPAKIAEAVRALTREDKSEDYMTYIRRVAENPLAIRVKLADLRDNLSPDRPILDDQALAADLKARYEKALEFLVPISEKQAKQASEPE